MTRKSEQGRVTRCPARIGGREPWRQAIAIARLVPPAPLTTVSAPGHIDPGDQNRQGDADDQRNLSRLELDRLRLAPDAGKLREVFAGQQRG